MRFSPIYMSLLVTSVLASPAPVAVPDPAPNTQMSVRSVADINHIAETNIYEVESAKCKLLKCLTIVDTATCVYDAGFDLDLTLACVNGDSAALCNCAGCNKKLNGWLTDMGICDP